MKEYKQVYIPVYVSTPGLGVNVDEDMGDAYLDREKAMEVLLQMVEKVYPGEFVFEDDHYIWRPDAIQGLETWIGWLEQRNLDEDSA
jgi:hypothetical protein